ncbi:MAG TPA: stage II sporulation protein M [Marinagarivorans sp.]
MKQRAFEQRYEGVWRELEVALTRQKGRDDGAFPERYRELCHHLAIAKQRRYSPQLIERLNTLVTQGHHYFYSHTYRGRLQWLEFVLRGFPRVVRANRLFVYVATALFVGPLLLMGLACYLNAEFVYSVLGVGDVAMMESMYEPGEQKAGRQRASDTDIYMFGFYIKNNIGISFQTFAGGILFGVGSIFFLMYNGIYIGAVAGHLAQAGYGSTFFPFVAGHGSFELTAIVLSGAAGLKLGCALICPGDQRMKFALKAAGKDAILIMYGAIIMLLIAAFIEAFWSSSTSIPALVRYAVGLCLWALVIGYFVASGRRRES